MNFMSKLQMNLEIRSGFYISGKSVSNEFDVMVCDMVSGMVCVMVCVMVCCVVCGMICSKIWYDILFFLTFPRISDNKPPVLSWRRKVPTVTGKRVRFKWISDEVAEFYCAHEKIEDMEKCGRFSLRGRWVESDLPEGRHRFWVVGVDDVGNRGIPLRHTWTVGKS